jgi:hypothetical protein
LCVLISDAVQLCQQLDCVHTYIVPQAPCAAVRAALPYHRAEVVGQDM